MPVTKKKGAVFAIYADTPPRGGSGSATPDADADAGPSTDAGPSGTNNAKATTSASSRPKVPRPALSALQPAPTLAATNAESSRSVAAKPTRSASAVQPSTTTKPARRAISTSGAGGTAAFDVFAEEPETKKAAAADADAEGRRKVAAQPLQPKVGSSAKYDIWGPPKRPRRVVAAARDEHDKENEAPPGSPAPRAPSKARAAIAVRGPTPIQDDDMGFKAKGKSSSTKTTRAPARIFEINPLADVSEAYGATCIEPDGFRDGRPVRWANPNANAKSRSTASTTRSKTIRS